MLKWKLPLTDVNVCVCLLVVLLCRTSALEEQVVEYKIEELYKGEDAGS